MTKFARLEYLTVTYLHFGFKWEIFSTIHLALFFCLNHPCIKESKTKNCRAIFETNEHLIDFYIQENKKKNIWRE